MARPITWAVRVTFPNGRTAFLRRGGVIGQGPIESYRTKELAEAAAAILRGRMYAANMITVIERSHGRQF